MWRASKPGHRAAVEAIYRAVTAPELWGATLELLSDEIGASGGMLAYHPLDGRRDFQLAGRLREDLNALYLKRHASTNVYARVLARMPPGRVYVANQIVDVGVVRKSAFHADILAPQAIENLVVCPHPSLHRQGGTGGVSFALSDRQNEEVERVVARLRQLKPHLFRSIDLTLQFGQPLSASSQIERILDAMPSAALLLDRKALIIRANRAADALLRRCDGVMATRTDGLRLSTQDRTETRKLATAITQALAIARGEECEFQGSIRITRLSSRSPLLALVTPLPPAAFSLWEAVEGGARALVQIIDPNEPTDTHTDILRAFAGLTETEARVAALVGAYPSVAAIAARLGVSVNTARTHLKRVFDKTGARSQAELARLIASIPGFAASVETQQGESSKFDSEGAKALSSPK